MTTRPGSSNARSSGATEADSLALGCMIMVWLLTVFAAIRHLRSQATTVSICRCRPSGEGHSSDVVRAGPRSALHPGPQRPQWRIRADSQWVIYEMSKQRRRGPLTPWPRHPTADRSLALVNSSLRTYPAGLIKLAVYPFLEGL
jgi:hypothetical protein